MVYQFGMLFTGGGFGIGTVVAVIVLAALLYLLLRKNKVADEHTLRAVAAAK